MNLLIDTNIVIDVLRKREEDYAASRLLLALGSLHEFELWISPTQLSDLFYILSRGSKRSLAAAVKDEVSGVLQFVHVCTFGDEETRAALSGDFDDLEDALIYQAARTVRAEAIITRSQEDFAGASIPAKNSSEFFEWLRETRGVNYAEIAMQASE